MQEENQEQDPGPKEDGFKNFARRLDPQIKVYPEGRLCLHCGFPLSVTNGNKYCRAYFQEIKDSLDCFIEARLKKHNQFLYSEGEIGRAKPKVQEGCAVEDCRGRYYCQGLCKSHYRAKYEKKTRNGICSVEGCGKMHRARGLCVIHWQKIRRQERRDLKNKIQEDGRREKVQT